MEIHDSLSLTPLWLNTTPPFLPSLAGLEVAGKCGTVQALRDRQLINELQDNDVEAARGVEQRNRGVEDEESREEREDSRLEGVVERRGRRRKGNRKD